VFTLLRVPDSVNPDSQLAAGTVCCATSTSRRISTFKQFIRWRATAALWSAAKGPASAAVGVTQLAAPADDGM